MIEEPFATGTSLIHRIDPRHRLLAAAVYSVLVAVSYDVGALLGALVWGIVLAYLARLDIRLVSRRLLVVSGFLILIWVVLPATYEGRPLAVFGPVTLSREGATLSLQITMKTLAITLTLMALVATMTAATLGYALGSLGVPDKLVTLLLITYRYIFVIEQEYTRLSRAARIRGFRPGTSLHSYKTYAYFVGMLFVRAADRANRVYQAMRCRGFRGRFYTLAVFPPHARNWAFSLVMGLMTVGIAWLEWGGKGFR